MCVFVRACTHVCVYLVVCLYCLYFNFHHCVFTQKPAAACGVATLENCNVCRMLCGRITSDAGLCHQHLSVVNILHTST